MGGSKVNRPGGRSKVKRVKSDFECMVIKFHFHFQAQIEASLIKMGM